MKRGKRERVEGELRQGKEWKWKERKTRGCATWWPCYLVKTTVNVCLLFGEIFINGTNIVPALYLLSSGAYIS